VLRPNPVAFPDSDDIALAISDGQTHAVWGTGPLAESLRDDIPDWLDSADGNGTLVVALHNLHYFTVDGPHTFEGDTDTAGPALARTYGIA
jgi:hypothetical protein